MEFLKHSEERYLRYDFTGAEISELSTSLANQVQQKANITSEKKSANAQFKSQLDTAEATIEALSDKVASRYEMRKVDCKVKYHRPEQGFKTVTRSDNGQKIVEKMTQQEWNLFNQESTEKEESAAPTTREPLQLGNSQGEDYDEAEVF